ncbi:hypothetical protein BH10PLA1_BH10PLA1_13170 [soil metagenome]
MNDTLADLDSPDAAPSNADANDVSRRLLLAGAATAGAAIALSPLLSGCSSAGTPAAQSRSGGASDGSALPVTLNINDKPYELQLEPRVTLLDALRENLGLNGSKKGCDHGQCGACTVLVNDRRVNSCLMLAVAAQGKTITTVEGLANGDELHPVQAAFIEHDGFQCGYCTPGQICSAVGLLKEGHAKTDDDIRELMSGNICRCGAYPNIVAAVKAVMSKSA